LQAIIDACSVETLPAQVVLVVSNRRGAYGLKRAQAAGIPTLYFPLRPYTAAVKSRQEYDADLAEQVSKEMPDLIILAGWMHILSGAFLDKFEGQVINLHPALPGQFPGTDAIERAFYAFRAGKIEYTGCMVHYAVPEVDAGPVILKSRVPIYLEDTLETLLERMHQTEHRVIVEATERALVG
jgi:formyltetrahydrofolate-dependent phosphoribosylglycinamide formyltransferase